MKPKLLITLLISIVSLGLTLSLKPVHPALADSAIVIKPSASNGWNVVVETGSAAGDFVTGPAVSPLGAGSVQFSTATSSGGVLIGAPLLASTPLSDITKLEYNTYQDAASSGTVQAISLQFNIDNDLTDGDNGWKGRLVFEPYYTETVVKGSWQSWNPMTQGKWWGNGAAISAVCSIASPCTWAQLLAAFPNAGVHSSFGAVLLKAGSGWPAGFNGNVDALTIGVQGNNSTFDFEPETPCAGVCYVNGAAGDDAFGGDSPASAKKTIQAAVNQVDSGGSVLVAAGSYPEQVTITKTLSLTGTAGAAGTTILAPATLPPASNPDSAIVKISGAGVNVELTGFTVMGPGPAGCGSILAGIFVRDDAYAHIHHNRILDIRDNPLSGCQNGIGILIGRTALSSSGSATLNDNLVAGYQKTGIVVSYGSSSAAITGNTVRGIGPTSLIAQNGIQVSSGATAAISGNTIDAHSYTPFSYVSTGVLLYGADADTTGNTISEAQVGIYHLDGSGIHNANIISATTAGTSSPGFWGIIVDAPPPSRQPAPFDELAASVSTLIPDPKATLNPAAVQAVVVTNNTLSGDGTATGVGLEADAGFGALDIDLVAAHNFIQNWGTGVIILTCASSCSDSVFTRVDLNLNSITSNLAGLANSSAFPVNGEANWWGDPAGPSGAGAGAGDSVSAAVDFDPWLCQGVDTDPAPGFQPNQTLCSSPINYYLPILSK